jgi:hypothetical protein
LDLLPLERDLEGVLEALKVVLVREAIRTGQEKKEIFKVEEDNPSLKSPSTSKSPSFPLLLEFELPEFELPSRIKSSSMTPPERELV